MTRRSHTLSLPASLPRSFVTTSPGTVSPLSRTQRTSLSSSLDSDDLSVLHRRSNAVGYRSSSEDSVLHRRSDAVGYRSGSEDDIPQEQSPAAPPSIRIARNLSSSYSELQSQHAVVHSYLPAPAFNHESNTGTPSPNGSTTLSQRVLNQFVGGVQALYHSIDRRRYVVRPPRVLQRSAVGNSLEARGCSAPLQPLTLEDRESCAICLEEFDVGDIVQPMLRCRHLFHRSCMKQFVSSRRDAATGAWPHVPLGDRVKCPLCRGRFSTASPLDVPDQEWELRRYLDEDFNAVMEPVTRLHHGQSASRQNSDADRTHSPNTEIALNHLRSVMGMTYQLSTQQRSGRISLRHRVPANAIRQDVESSVDSVPQSGFSNIVDLDVL